MIRKRNVKIRWTRNIFRNSIEQNFNWKLNFFVKMGCIDILLTPSPYQKRCPCCLCNSPIDCKFCSSQVTAPTESPRSYDAAFCSDLDRKYLCPVCLSALHEPMQTSCGHRFCKTCIQGVIKYVPSVCPATEFTQTPWSKWWTSVLILSLLSCKW